MTKTIGTIKTKGTDTYGKLETALERLTPQAKVQYLKSAQNMQRILPDESFTMRMETILSTMNYQVKGHPVMSNDDKCDLTNALRNSLGVFIKDPKISAWLRLNDPKALKQACMAVKQTTDR